MKRFFLFACFLLSVTLRVAAIDIDSLMNAEKKEMHRIPRQMLTLQVGFNVGDDASVATELDYHYYPLKYAGLGFGMEVDDNHGNDPLVFGSMGEDDDAYDVDRILKVNFHPMLAFRTPSLWFGHDRSWGAMLRCDPGVVLSVPANDVIYVTENVRRDEDGIWIEHNRTIRNHGGKWFFWRVRSGLSVYNETAMVTLGVSYSNYNINYCRNHMENNGHRLYGHDSFSHTVSLFVSASYCF